jgi:ubiquinone/menaquinone biosynthesis C-methylase UbiE
MMASDTPSAPEDYLATGFAHVDARQQVEPFAACLTLLDNLPHFRAYKERSYELLELHSGQSILEVGCGLGDDLRRMAQRLGDAGRLVGVDASLALLEQARSRLMDWPHIEWTRADARRLPFSPGHFDRCRIDRTLQHIQHPEQVVAEMTRILRPGGRMLAYDNDWGTFSISGQDETTSRHLEDLWTGAITNRVIGRQLPRLFQNAGLTLIQVEPSVSVLTDFELADQVYNLSTTGTLAIERGLVDAERVERWLEDLQTQSREGVFLCSLTAYTVVGQKP